MKVKKICCLILATILSFSLFSGCDKNNDEDKDVFTQDELFFADSEIDLITSYIDFKNTEESLQNSIFITNNQTFYYLINTEEYGDIDHFAYTPPTYSLYKFSNDQNADLYFVSISANSVLDKNAPQKVGCGLYASGLPERNCMYNYIAYPTDNININLKFKHAIFSTTQTTNRLVLVYQNDNLIGIFKYYATVPDDSYYEQFLKDNLIIVGVNSNES